MLYYNRIDISEGSKLTKSNRECMIYHYSFFNHRIECQDSVYKGCHGFTILSVNIRDIIIITIKNIDYRYMIYNFSTSKAVKLLKNSVLENCWYI